MNNTKTCKTLGSERKRIHAYLVLLFMLDLAQNVIEQNVGIPMETPLNAERFLLCYERYLMRSLVKDKLIDMLDAINSISWPICSISL